MSIRDAQWVDADFVSRILNVSTLKYSHPTELFAWIVVDLANMVESHDDEKTVQQADIIYATACHDGIFRQLYAQFISMTPGDCLARAIINAVYFLGKERYDFVVRSDYFEHDSLQEFKGFNGNAYDLMTSIGYSEKMQVFISKCFKFADMYKIDLKTHLQVRYRQMRAEWENVDVI